MKFEDFLFETVTLFCGHNPGAISFFMESIERYPDIVPAAFNRMLANDIKEDKLYMLWNDCCDRDTQKTLFIMLHNPIEDIVEHINYDNGRGIRY